MCGGVNLTITGNKMKIEQKVIEEFEKNLVPHKPELSKAEVMVKGFGEISSIFSVKDYPGWIFKRLPLFNDDT